MAHEETNVVKTEQKAVRIRPSLIDPLTRRRLQRFKSIKRAYISLIVMLVLIGFSLLAELFVNNRALLVSYQGKLILPTYGRVRLGTEFGYTNQSEVNYRQLQADLKASGEGWVIMPLIPYGPFEINLGKNILPDDYLGQTYIGISVGQASRNKSAIAADYLWSTIDDMNGIQTGLGPDGSPRYAWVKYANDQDGDGLSDFLSRQKKYIGLALDQTSRSESRRAEDYTWFRIGGRRGLSLDGGQTYVWVKFAGDASGNVYPPTQPDLASRHLLGTDRLGRDVLARLLYGFRIAIIFSLLLTLITFFVGNTIGMLMGLLGGPFDLFFQRIIEIWERMPFLYMIIIVASIMRPTFGILLGIMTFFGWASRTWTVRAMTYRERERDYILAARSMGASLWRIINVHIFPNILVVVLTSLPFAIVGGIGSLTSLDYLGFGLPPPTPSWGELLQVGIATFRTAPWILSSVVTAIVLVLVMISFVGEGLRDAFDPKRYTVYK